MKNMDNFILMHIMSFMDDVSIIMMRASCRQFRLVQGRSTGQMTNIIPYAIKHDNLELLKYACELGHPWKYVIGKYAPLCAESPVCKEYIHENFCTKDSMIIHTGMQYNVGYFIRCAIELFEHGCPLNELSMIYIIQYCTVKELKKLCKLGAPLSVQVFNIACERTYTAFLECLYKFKCPWNETTSATAADFNSNLQYLHKNGCPWDETTCIAAARKDRVILLKYAHENGCPLTKITYEAAVAANAIRCIEYLDGIQIAFFADVNCRSFYRVHRV